LERYTDEVPGAQFIRAELLEANNISLTDITERESLLLLEVAENRPAVKMY
jgi:hypothetical protein